MRYTGIKALCSASKSLPAHGYGPGCYEVFADSKTGRVWGNYQTSRNSWTEYDDPDIIPCGWISTPATMADIKTRVMCAYVQRIGL